MYQINNYVLEKLTDELFLVHFTRFNDILMIAV